MELCRPGGKANNCADPTTRIFVGRVRWKPSFFFVRCVTGVYCLAMSQLQGICRNEWSASNFTARRARCSSSRIQTRRNRKSILSRRIRLRRQRIADGRPKAVRMRAEASAATCPMRAPRNGIGTQTTPKAATGKIKIRARFARNVLGKSDRIAASYLCAALALPPVSQFF